MTELFDALVPLLDDPDPGTRKRAVAALAWMGTAATVAPLRRAFMDADADVPDGALTGLLRANSAWRLEAATKEGLFEPLMERLRRTSCHKSATLLMSWGRARAVAEFRVRGLMDPACPGFASAIDAMTTDGTLLPREELLELRARLANERQETRAHIATLRMLAAHVDPKDGQLLRSVMEAGGATAGIAADALLRLHGLHGLISRIQARRRDSVREALSRAELSHFAMWLFDGEVNNGGLDQFFFNDAGDTWRLVLAGFEEVGDLDRAAILREACERFSTAPNEDRYTRQEQLARLEERTKGLFEDLDARYYGLETSFQVTHAKHALAHAEELRRR